jgi:hypothetical protein
MSNDAPRRILVSATKRELTPELRVGFALVVISGVLAVVLGSLYIVRSVNKPFDISYEGPLFLTESQKQSLEMERQKDRDTDTDGLSDYDELYVHGTSPYLRDTDGDGFFDLSEIESGNDPTTSASAVRVGSQISDGFLDVANERIGDSVQLDVPTVDALANSANQTDPSNVTAGEIREALQLQGATEEQLSEISDQELLDQYFALLEQYEAGELELETE